MVPPASHPTWAKLIKGDVKPHFAQASAGMLFGNLQREYQKDPSKLPQHVQQAREFFTKYEKAMAADIQKLFG
jgi:hypothetical protein